MKELPEFAFLTAGEDLPGMKIICLESPYIIASVYEVSQNDPSKVEEHLEDLVQQRYPIAKVKGYSIFLKVYTSLEPEDNAEYQQRVLNDMADFFLKEKVLRKPGRYRNCDESGVSQVKYDPERQIRLRQRRKKA